MQISIRNLSKIYNGEKKALDAIDLEIGNGLFGLLGPNGAGKTTLMRILVTLLAPTEGEVTIDGRDLKKHRAQIRRELGYLPQEFSSFPKIKTWEFLDYSARLAGIKKYSERLSLVDEFLQKVGLFEARDRLAGKLSGGMKRRLGIAQALISNPRILVIDEPTTGLDPEERIRFRNLLTEMGEEERIIILSTHIVGDISSTCRDMALMSNGRIGFNGSPEVLIEKARGHTYQLLADDSNIEQIREKYTVISTIPSEKGWQIEVVGEAPEESYSEIEPNLEHAYVYFMETEAS